MSYECNFSFADLFFAAHKRQWRDEEVDTFMRLSQEEKNNKVKKLAKQAGWQVSDKIGTDGRVYTAFAPSGEPKLLLGNTSCV